MKSLSASVNSSEPISVKAASRILSRFISKENGASKAVSSYLKRTSNCIDELIQFHRDLRSHQSSRRPKTSISLEKANNGHLTQGAITSLGEDKSGTETEIVTVQRKKIKEELKDDRGNVESKKKRKVVEMADKGEVNEDEEHRKKKKKRKKSHVED
ncbi:hypothetical protein H6P81_019108 [Aristolochia fimbriata]|uniref:Uncharacterized protein n=1 Tax=Aristolochia fimbriata TaxID=158543 RepID=A0AAV7DRQ7_ARIFI|nr:hypothetical protein H6P81_019108 [Aristolochia fimbriata]